MIEVFLYDKNHDTGLDSGYTLIHSDGITAHHASWKKTACGGPYDRAREKRTCQIISCLPGT